MAKIVVAESEADAWDRYAWTLASSANHTFRAGIAGKLVPEEHVEGLAAIRRGYDSREHSQLDKGDRHARARSRCRARRVAWPSVPRRWRAGAPAARVEELGSHGASNLMLTAIFGDPHRYTEEMAELLLR